MKNRFVVAAISAGIPVVTLAVVLGWFCILATPAAENIPQLLAPTESEPAEWSYRVNGEEVSPNWSPDGYFEGLPAGGDRAEAEASLTLEEGDSPGDYLYFMISDYALTVTLGDATLYEDDRKADFSGLYRTLYVNLPEDWAGKKLTVTVKGPVYDGYVFPCFPIHTNDTGFYAGYVGEDVKPIALSGAAAAVAVILALLFVFELRRGPADWRALLLLLFALAYMAASSAQSFAMSAHFPEEKAGVFLQQLELPCFLYLDVLLIFFALHMKLRNKIILCAGVTFHVLWICFLASQSGLQTLGPLQTAPHVLLLMMTLGLMAAEYRNKRLFRLILWATAPIFLLFSAGVLLVLRGNCSEWVLPVQAALFGNWLPVSIIFSVYLTIVSCIGMLADFLYRQAENQALLRAANLQAQYAIQNALNLKEAIDRSKETRHEYRHHLEALQGLCRDGDVARVEQYVNRLFQDDDALPTLIYAESPLVNALVSSCAAHCKESQVRFSASVQAPEKLNIEDTDLAVLLTNMLDNALEAASEMPEGQRWIRLRMGIYKDIGLFVSCENTFLESRLKVNGEEILSSKGGKDHGFGLRAMRRVAQKYNSVLRVSHKDGVFKVGTCLSLVKTR